MGIILIIKDMQILQLLIALVDGYAYIILDMDQLLAKTLSPIAGIVLFMNYGDPEKFSSDGGPQFTLTPFKMFFKTWSVKHSISLLGYPQSNRRAEAAVKTAKQIIRENTSKDGFINNDNIAKAIMQYCNTPLPNVSLSSAHTLFHRELHDFTLSHPTHHQLHKGWIASQEQREYIAAKQNIKHTERYNTMAHALQPLPLGTPVLIQNTGNHLQH